MTRRRQLLFLITLAVAIAAISVPADAGPSPVGAGNGSAFSNAKPAWLGVSMVPAPAGKDGVLAQQIVPGSPAAQAGIHIGDRLLKVAGHLVQAPIDVQRAVGGRAPGDVLVVLVDRDGKEISFRIDLAERPSPEAMARATYLGKPAPNLTGLVSVSGPPITTESLRNRVVIVDFWAIWCVPCRLSMPALSAMQARYGAQGLTVLSITSDPVDRAAGFAHDLGLRTTVAVDKEGSTTGLYGVSVLPTTFVVDRRGIVRDIALGYDRTQEAKLDATVRALLAEPEAPPAPPVLQPSPSTPTTPAPSIDAGAPAPKVTRPASSSRPAERSR